MRTTYGETYGLSTTPIPTAAEFTALHDERERLAEENERLRALLILATETIAALDPNFDTDPLPIHEEIRATLKGGAK